MAESDYRHYFTELVRAQGQGKTFSMSLHDLTHPDSGDGRTAEEIAAEVTANAGLEVRGESA